MNRFADARTLDEVVFQAIGAGSVCWNWGPLGVFDTESATQIGQEAVDRILEFQRSALLLYSEWLDADEQLMKKPKKKDHRTHEDLVNKFLDT